MKWNAPGSPRFIMGVQYSLYFGVLGVFLPYFNLYCYHLGFTGGQIGILSAVRTGTTILFPLVFSALADRYGARRPLYLALNMVSTGIWCLYLFTQNFVPMLIVTLFYGIFYAPIIAFLEAMTMDALGAEGRSYGRIRVWGSVHFIAATLIVGKFIDIYPVNIILIVILAGSLLQTAVAFRLPRPAGRHNLDFLKNARSLWNRRVIVFLVCAFLMLVSHGAYYGFFSIHLERLGFSGGFIGFAWALASIAEILVMVNSRRIFTHISIKNALLFAFFLSCARWLILFRAESAGVILLSQILHAGTYGLFHVASILHIDRLSPAEAKTLGQAVNNAATYGLGTMAGFLMSGLLFESAGMNSLFLISGGIAAFGGVLLYLCRGNEKEDA